MNDKFDKGTKEINNRKKYDFSVISDCSYLFMYDTSYNDKPRIRMCDNESMTKFSDELMFNEKRQKYRYEVTLQIEDKKDFPIYFAKRYQK